MQPSSYGRKQGGQAVSEGIGLQEAPLWRWRTSRDGIRVVGDVIAIAGRGGNREGEVALIYF